jgi:hypothetical protein
MGFQVRLYAFLLYEVLTHTFPTALIDGMTYRRVRHNNRGCTRIP